MASVGSMIQRLPCQTRSSFRASLRPVRSANLLHRSLVPQQRLMQLHAESASKSSAETEVVSAAEEDFEDEDDGVGLSTAQVEAFLSILCEDTEIAELELKMGSFQMKVRRSLKGAESKAVAPTEAEPAAARALTNAQLVAALPAAPPMMQPLATQSLLSFDEDDESVVCITSPKVGIFRRGRYLKGKKMGKAPVVDVGDKVKKGQTVAYVDQLGTFVAVEAPQAGEIASFLKTEGQPVEYGEDVVELAPFFGGHIIGDSKYA